MSEMAYRVLVYFAMTSWIGWVFLFVGIGAMRTRRRREDREHTRAAGTIVDYVPPEARAGKGGGPDLRRPVVEFVADGRRYRLENENRMDRERHPVGEAVEVLYEVSDPTRFHLESDAAFYRGGRNAVRLGVLWIAASAALTLALAMLVGGAGPDLRYLWRRLQRFAHPRR